ncbi:MAG TPA: aminotransferase [Alphaproteobacteria bacterium]|nr:aminotransferase [Alphaproteobacteria bacterium]HAJ48685.1 aminotransferase [Alphaproteobacteria bacterium]
MKPLNPIFAGAGTTIFTTMSALAVQHQAINLGQGFPDEDGPEPVRAAAAKALMDGPNQYPPMMGMSSLREALAHHAEHFYGIKLDWQTQTVVTSGATEALTASIMGLVKPGDEVILIEPAYDCYRPVIEAVGGTVRPIRLGPPRWELTADMLAAAFGPKTKAILINSPMNPAGKVFSPDELQAIAELVQKHDCLAICDEVYEHLTFEGRRHVPLATLPGMAERSVRVGSAGKMFSLTGWKVGWVTGAAPLIAAIAKAHQYLTFTTPNALQVGIAEGITRHMDFTLGLTRELEAKRNKLRSALQELGFEALPCDGTYFLTVDISGLRFNGSDVEFCKAMTERAKVTAIPLSVFYSGEAPLTLVRFAFCKKMPVLEEAVRRLQVPWL